MPWPTTSRRVRPDPGAGQAGPAGPADRDRRLPQPGDTCVFASAGGRKHALRCTIAARQEFAGYWEYMLDEAIFTAPAHPSWGGAGLIGRRRQAAGHRLAGHAAAGRQGRAGSTSTWWCRPACCRRSWPTCCPMAAATSRRGPGSASMRRRTRTASSSAPWPATGPAQKAGMQEGDRIAAVGGTKVADLAGLWRAVWACGRRGRRCG